MASNIVLENLTLNANTTASLYLDADLARGRMDTLNVDTSSDPTKTATVGAGAKLNIAGIDVISDAENESTTINFTQDAGLQPIIAYTGEQDIKAMSPIYTYNIDYNVATGDFIFTRKGYNPTIYTGSVASQVGSYFSQVNSYNTVLSHMSNLATNYIGKNLSNSAEKGMSAGDTVNRALDRDYSQNKASTWVKPYTSIEDITLSDGLVVDNTTYGAMFGIDSAIHNMGNGFIMQYSFYGAFNGSEQEYANVDVNQNGGQVGASLFLMNNNFWTGLTANIGLNFAEADTMYGTEYFDSLVAGIASKTGYNFNFEDAGIIIQPSLLLSYSYVKTFDYKNAAGVEITSTPLHVLQISPELKIIKEFENNLQAYVKVEGNWFSTSGGEFTANDVSLPMATVESYWQYGLGFEKDFGEDISLFGEANIMTGSREGFSAQVGLKWEF